MTDAAGQSEQQGEGQRQGGGEPGPEAAAPLQVLVWDRSLHLGAHKDSLELRASGVGPLAAGARAHITVLWNALPERYALPAPLDAVLGVAVETQARISLVRACVWECVRVTAVLGLLLTCSAEVSCPCHDAHLLRARAPADGAELRAAAPPGGRAAGGAAQGQAGRGARTRWRWRWGWAGCCAHRPVWPGEASGAGATSDSGRALPSAAPRAGGTCCPRLRRRLAGRPASRCSSCWTRCSNAWCRCPR